jgi:hypothetical protein
MVKSVNFIIIIKFSQFSTVKDFFNNRPQILEDESSDQHVKIHTNLISQTLTLYRSIVDNVTKRQIALVGTQFKPQFFNSIWSDLLKKSSVWKICKNVGFLSLITLLIY